MKARTILITLILITLYSNSFPQEISEKLVYLKFEGMPRKHIPSLIWMDKAYSPNWKLTEIFYDSFDAFTFINTPKFSLSKNDAFGLLSVLNEMSHSNDGEYRVMIFDVDGLLSTFQLSRDEIRILANFTELNCINGYQILMRWAD